MKKFSNPWPVVVPIDEKFYNIELLDGSVVENVEFWALRDVFIDYGSNVFPSSLVKSFEIFS